MSEVSLRDKYNWMVREEILTNYIQTCEEAAYNNEVFKTFKRDPYYTAILEHCSKNVAMEYFKFILKDNAWLLGISEFKENDKYGGSKIENFIAEKASQVWRYSSSTMQYIGVLSNLIKYFGPLQNFSIVEIGGGYGGQCKIIQDAFRVTSYDIIDLPEVSYLQDTYLTKLEVSHFALLTDPDMVQMYSKTKTPYSLVISNYALSEILEPLQTQYVESILLNSKRGYITCNREIKALQLLKDKFKSLQILPDIEGEAKDNYIIIWNEK